MKIKQLLTDLRTSHPQLSFHESETFYWSPADKTVYYSAKNDTKEGLWALLHETGHALRQHTQYYSDIELVQMEVEAWQEAKKLGAQHKIEVDKEHIEDCIDSYRDWLHKRSLCPDCHLSGIQIAEKSYECIFCQKQWQVTTERFCRPYRKMLT